MLIFVAIALFVAIMLNASRKTRSEPRTLDEQAAELEIVMRATPFD